MHFMLGPLHNGKVGVIGFYAFFLRPDLPREPALSSTGPHPPPALFQASGIVSGLVREGK